MKHCLVPRTGEKGAFAALEPFNNIIKPTNIFTVVGNEFLDVLNAEGLKPLDTIYKLVGLGDAEYQEDLVQRVPIVILRDGAGKLYYIPSDRLESIPLMNGVEYENKLLLVSIGSQRTDVDLQPLINDISDVVIGGLGVTPKVDVKITSGITLVSDDDNITIATRRQLLKNSKGNIRKQLQDALSRETILKKKIADLECIIKKKCQLV
jgi:hypothetical protein